MKICGGLAQLGERLNGIQKVRGSNPLSSTILWKDLGEVAGGWVEKALFTHKKKAPLMCRAVFLSLPIYDTDMWSGCEAILPTNDQEPYSF